jgi:hypothetical protein
MGRDLRLWHSMAYRRAAKALTDKAYANPRAVCWLCGRTLVDGPRYRSGRPSTWHADHVVAGDPRSPLRVAHSRCNESRSKATGRVIVRSPNA